MFHGIGGRYDSQWCPVLVACLFWAVCLPGLWSLSLVSFSLPFIGCFLFIKLPSLQSICFMRPVEGNWWRVWFLVVPFSPCSPPLLGFCLPGLRSLPLVSFSLPFVGCFLFIKLPSFQLICFMQLVEGNWWRVQFLVVPFSACGLPLLGCLLAWTLVLASYFFFSPFLGCFLFIKFGKVSSICF